MVISMFVKCAYVKYLLICRSDYFQDTKITQVLTLRSLFKNKENLAEAQIFLIFGKNVGSMVFYNPSILGKNSLILKKNGVSRLQKLGSNCFYS